MFRDLARKKQALSREDCIGLLKTELRGVLSVLGDEGYPYGVPLNHYYREADGKLYFHGGLQGHRVEALARCDKVSFCVLDPGIRKPGDWALTFRSVIVFGRMAPVEDPALAMEVCRELSRRFTDDEAYIQHEIQHSGPGTLVYALTPEHISGKRVHEA